MARVICELRPRWVVWENVRGAFSSNGGADFRAVLGSFSDIGYDAQGCQSESIATAEGDTTSR
jgi:site-specific DNA-cytosine methylase